MKPLHMLGLAVALAGSFGAAHPASAQQCEPGKLAEKYPSLAGKTLKIGVDPQTPPYVTRDPKEFEKLVGFDADLARATLDCAGIKYTFFTGGWSGLLPALIAGQIDVFWNDLYYTPERAKQVDYVLYMQAGTGALGAAGNPQKIAGMDDLCGKTVAVGLGTVEEPQVRKQSETCQAGGKAAVTTMTFPDVSAGTRLVGGGRADVMLYDLALIDALAQQNPKQYANLFKMLSGFGIGVAVKKGNADLLNAIDDGLKTVQATGQQKAIFAKYTMDPELGMKAEVKTK